MIIRIISIAPKTPKNFRKVLGVSSVVLGGIEKFLKSALKPSRILLCNLLQTSSVPNLCRIWVLSSLVQDGIACACPLVPRFPLVLDVMDLALATFCLSPSGACGRGFRAGCPLALCQVDPLQ